MTHDLETKNETRSMMKGTYTDSKLDKSKELNANMTINEASKDEYESTLHNLGGNANGN